MLKGKLHGIYAEENIFLRTNTQKENILIEKRRCRKIYWSKTYSCRVNCFKSNIEEGFQARVSKCISRKTRFHDLVRVSRYIGHKTGHRGRFTMNSYVSITFHSNTGYKNSEKG